MVGGGLLGPAGVLELFEGLVDEVPAFGEGDSFAGGGGVAPGSVLDLFGLELAGGVGDSAEEEGDGFVDVVAAF